MASVPTYDGETLIVQVPLRLRKRGGRKLMIVPDGTTPWVPPRARANNAIVKAIARAHRWRQLLESGEYASITDLATAEKINQSYVCRILRLTLLAPDIVDAILDGRQTGAMDLALLMEPFPVDWRKQCNAFGPMFYAWSTNPREGARSSGRATRPSFPHPIL